MSEQNKIDEIKARHASATPGPWKFNISHGEYGLYGANERILSFGGRSGHEEYRGQEPGLDDEYFIGHSWSDVQILLQEIERLQKEEEFWKQAAENQRENNYELLKKIAVKDEALRIYADEDSYYGQRAREAL